jgi:hypothetical protein
VFPVLTANWLHTLSFHILCGPSVCVVSVALQPAQEMSKNVENNKDGGILSSEPELSKPQSFKDFLYDPNTGAVLGRTGGNWSKNFKSFQLTNSNALTVLLVASVESCDLT